MNKKFKLTEDFAGKAKGTELLLEGDKKLSISWKYKGAAVILTEESTIIKEYISLIDKIKTIEDVYKELGRVMPTIKDYKFLPKEKQERALNSQYIDDISELFNDDWKLDWNNSRQYKYYPYFIKNGSGWSLYYVHIIIGGSDHGSGFYYKDRDTAQLCATGFLDIYKKVLD